MVFVTLHRQRPAVESAIDNQEHRGLDWVHAFGADAFGRVVALSIFNIRRTGPLPRRVTGSSGQSVIPGPPNGGNGDLCPNTGNGSQI